MLVIGNSFFLFLARVSDVVSPSYPFPVYPFNAGHNCLGVNTKDIVRLYESVVSPLRHFLTMLCLL